MKARPDEDVVHIQSDCHEPEHGSRWRPVDDVNDETANLLWNSVQLPPGAAVLPVQEANDAPKRAVGVVLDEFGQYVQHWAAFLADPLVDAAPSLRTGRRAVILSLPHGVICAMSPWIYPFVRAPGTRGSGLGADAAPARKPPSIALAVGALIERLFIETFGDHLDPAPFASTRGSALATNDGVDFVVFIGSTRVDRQLAAEIAPYATSAHPESGREKSAIMTQKARRAHEADGVVWGRFSTRGIGFAVILLGEET